MAADADLLFGLIALTVGKIDHAQLVAAFDAWSRNPARTLADHLCDAGSLDASGRAAVEAMVARHIQRHGGDACISPGPVTADLATRKDPPSLGDADTEAAMVDLGLASTQAGEDSVRPIAYTIGVATADGQRFRILRPHAQGGLGTVFVALDGELNREVALKQIRDNHADDPVSRQRFLLEAEVTGGLEHPGIVPVYSLGTYDDGRPYYAMRFVRGDSLKEAIDHFHSDAALKNEPGRRSLELRKLLGRFTDVCNAIDYAHSRGVLHRDIKPGNIIVGKHGETLVVDWGLAKAQGRQDTAESLEERAFLPRLSSGSAETLPGSALGTPSYMSPEQARGDLEHIGPRSDVYSLGATLYCVLIGKPPFENLELKPMLSAVQKGEFPHPRKLDPSVDRALEAICLKAMALKPEDRYATPRALADDIERWLADEPVKAYVERPLERLGRWLRQHRTWTYAAAAALVGIALAATIGVVVVDGARRREAVVRKEAETNFNMALKAVDDYLTSVSENTLFQLQDSVDIRRLRQELLNSALKYYQSFVNQRSHDPQLRRQLALAYYRVGEITKEIESPDQAIDAFRAAQAIWEPLVAAQPGDRELRGRLAQSYLALGKLQNASFNLDLDGAARSLAKARAILEPLTADLPLEPRYQSSLADCYSEIASVQARREQSAETLALLEKARAIEKDLINRYPDKHAYRKSLAEITNVIGFACYKLGKNDEALQAFREVQRICQNILSQVSVGPRPLWLLNLLALSHSNIAWMHVEKRDFDQALKSFEQSLEYRSALVQQHPSVIDYRAKFGLACREMAPVQHEAHQDAQAFLSIEKSIEVFTGLVRAQPGHAAYHSELGLSFNYLGCLYDAARKYSEALAAFKQAVAEQQLAVDLATEDDYRGYLGNHLENLGEQVVAAGRAEEGLSLYRRSLKLLVDLSSAHPRQRAHGLSVLRLLVKLGTTERHSGDSAAARQSFANLRTRLDEWSAAAPDDIALRILLGAALDREAVTLLDHGLAEKAREALERALVLLQKDADVAAAGKERAGGPRPRLDVRYVTGRTADDGDVGIEKRRWQSEVLWDLARVLRALKRPEEAARRHAQRVALWQDRPPAELVDVALAELDRAIVIGFGRTPVSDQAKAVRELDLDQAAAHLRLAIKRGFRDLQMLNSHPDVQILLSRDDLKLPIMDMSLPSQPFAHQ